MLSEKLWDEISGFDFDDFDSVKKRFNEYENVVSELHCSGVIEDEWEKLEEKLLYGFIVCCFIELYCNRGRFCNDINNVIRFCVDEVKKMKFSLGEMMIECQLYDFIILIKDMWERYLEDLRKDMDR